MDTARYPDGADHRIKATINDSSLVLSEFPRLIWPRRCLCIRMEEARCFRATDRMSDTAGDDPAACGSSLRIPRLRITQLFIYVQLYCLSQNEARRTQYKTKYL